MWLVPPKRSTSWVQICYAQSIVHGGIIVCQWTSFRGLGVVGRAGGWVEAGKLAEARVSRTHRCPWRTTAGFEDREDHRNLSASCLMETQGTHEFALGIY